MNPPADFGLMGTLLLPFIALMSIHFGRTTAYTLGIAASLLAILAGMTVPSDHRLVLDSLLLGSVLGLTPISSVLLVASGLVWLFALLHSYRHPLARNAVRFEGFLLMGMAGNFIALLALDAVTFFLGYALMGLAAAPLVGHRHNTLARRSMILYLGFTLVGESLLLAALLHMAHRTESLLLTDLRTASDTTGVTLLLLALGIKLATVGLHTWIAPAYRTTPTPGAAVLSGSMMNVGVLGLLVLLPLDRSGFENIALVMISLGVLASFYGVLMGLGQQHPKSMLGYSSMSQMGLLTLTLGLGLYAGNPQTASAVVALAALFAVHHGILKGSMFLLVGEGRPPRNTLILTSILALALAGFPLTSGWWAKAELKSVLEYVLPQAPSYLGLVLALSSVATTLLMARLLITLWSRHKQSRSQAMAAPLYVGSLAVVGLVGLPAAYLIGGLGVPSLSDSWLVPLVVVALIVVRSWLAEKTAGIRLGRIPPGDIAWPILRSLRAVGASLERGLQSRPVQRIDDTPGSASNSPLISRILRDTETGLQIWAISGVGLVGLILTLVAGLSLG